MRIPTTLGALVLLPCLALAQETHITSAPASPREASVGMAPAFGGAKTFVAYTPWDAVPIVSDVEYAFSDTASGQAIYRTGGAQSFKIPVHLPSGARVTELEANYCDAGAFFVTFHWMRQPKNAPIDIMFDVISSDGPATPGCVVQTALLTPNATIDNNANSYHVELTTNGTNDTIQFLSLRVGYQLQVSLAPAVATFPVDVPTNHPFFRWIEALAAAGITAGCGPGMYCPDAAITRGQMAVFLATALGLHFVP